MFTLRKLFVSNPYHVPVSKAQRGRLERFLQNKDAYQRWLNAQPADPAIDFHFYYPAAIDFYFNGSKLYSAFFKKDAFGNPLFRELKMSEANYSAIRSADWRPFEEVIENFLRQVGEHEERVRRQQTKPLQEYMSICQSAVQAS